MNDEGTPIMKSLESLDSFWNANVSRTKELGNRRAAHHNTTTSTVLATPSTNLRTWSLFRFFLFCFKKEASCDAFNHVMILII